MADDIKTLQCAANNEEICHTLAQIGSNLSDAVLYDQYLNHGLIEVLRDLTGSSDTQVCLSALTLITRLVTDNHELKQKLCKPMGFLRTLMSLCSPFKDSGKQDKKLHLALHNQAAVLIKMLVLNQECMPEVAGIDLIGQMIALCGIFFDDSQHVSCCHGTLGYPSKATSYLHSLAHGRKLIGKVREMLPEASWQVVKALNVEEIFGSNSKVCALSVDLYDTTTDRDVVVKEELIKEKMAWPQFLSPEKEAKLFVKHKGKEDSPVWADITVTSVIDGGHFWAHVGGEVVNEKLRHIRDTLQKENQAKFKRIPDAGELVCCTTIVGGHQDVYRGNVLQVLPTQDEVMLEVFAVDYGFKNVVSMNCITQITPLAKREPYQARLCCLPDVQPPPSDAKVLINAAAALRNLAYQSNASRLQILDKNGVDALLKLIIFPDKEIRKQVIGAILNLSINFKTRARIGFLGGIKTLLNLIQNDLKEEIEVLCLAIGAIRNLILDSPINRGRCADADGLFILTNVYFTSANNDIQQQCLGALKNLVGNSWYLLTGNNGVDFRGIVDDRTVRPLSLSTVTTSQHLPSVHRRTRHLRPGEVEPQPIEKALPSHVIKRSSSQEAESGQDEMTDGDTDVEEKLLRSTTPSPLESPNDVKLRQDVDSFYVRGEAMPFNEDEIREFRYSRDAKSLSSAVIARPACAFLNAGNGGTVYLGIKKTGVVHGIEISRKDRDRLRVGIDELLGEFKPAVKYDKYQVSFVPVAEEGSGHSVRRAVEIISDLFVIEVTFSKSSGTVYTTNGHKCYVRCGNANSEYSVQGVRKWVIREQEKFYNDQINILRRELCAAKQNLGTDEIGDCF